jgi:hypothetical protein
MKARLAVAVLGSVLLSSAAASAEEPDACKVSYEGAQVSMMKTADGKSQLIKAREHLRTCLRSTCKDWVVTDCSRWLTEVEGRIPTVVFSAHDTAGHDLTDARVTTEDGEVVLATLDGRAMEMDAGARVYVFVRPDGTKREVRVLVREGEKAQTVRAIFDAPPGAEPVRPLVEVKTRGAEPATLKYVGYGVAGLGVVGIAIGSVFGLEAMSVKNGGNCDASGCDPGTGDDARAAANVATVGFIAGAALLAGGVALVLLSPSSSPARTNARARISPSASGLGLAW